MDRRRMLMSLRRNLVIFKHGDKQLTNGKLSGSRSFSGGVLTIKCEDNGDGTYHADHCTISDIDFGKYEKLCLRVNVPTYVQLAYPNEFLIAVGYGPASADKYDPDEWTEKKKYTEEGTFYTEFSLDKVQKGDIIFLSTNGGTTSGNYAELNVYDIWLE